MVKPVLEQMWQDLKQQGEMTDRRLDRYAKRSEIAGEAFSVPISSSAGAPLAADGMDDYALRFLDDIGDGQLSWYNPTADAWQAVQAVAPSPAIETIIAPTTLGSAVSNIQLGTVSSDPLPTDYETLMLVIMARGASVGSNLNLFFQLNNDTGSNYHGMFYYIRHTGVVTATDHTAGNSNPISSLIPAGSSPADYFGLTKIFFSGYKRAVNTRILSEYGTQSLTNDARTGQANYTWDDTSTVQEIDIYTSGNLDTGTTYALYGIK